MIVLIDIGNSSLKWCLQDAGVLTAPATLSLARTWQLPLQTAWAELSQPQKVLVSCVAATVIESQLATIVNKLWGLAPIFVRPCKLKHGLVVAYENPMRLGTDRWLAMLATRQRNLIPALVIDCGTAVTIDALDDVGNHLGGLILPGLNLLRKAIFAGTEIEQVELLPVIDLLGRDTGECIAAGTLQAIVGVIELVFSRLKIMGKAPHVVLTGGDAEPVARQLNIPYELIPMLVFEGLALWYS